MAVTNLEAHADQRVIHCDDRHAWLAARRGGIGSSDAPAILGMVRWGNSLSVYASKVAESEPDDDESEIMKWGSIMEPVILREFARERPDFGEPVRDGWMYTDGGHRLCTVDGWVGETHTEVKTANETPHLWDDQVPDHVFCQSMHQLHVLKRDRCFVVVLLRGYRLRWAVVERNQKFIDDVLLPAEDDLWTRIQNGDPPPPDASEATRKAIAMLYPNEQPFGVTLPGEFIDLDRERVEVMEQMATLQHRKDEIDNRIKFEIADRCEGLLADGTKYSYKTINRKAYSVAASSHRQLRRSGPKGE